MKEFFFIGVGTLMIFASSTMAVAMFPPNPEYESNYSFSQEVLDGLNEEYLKTPIDREFVAYLYVNDQNVFVDFNLHGIQTINSKILYLNNDVVSSKHVIHSHPGQVCRPSEKDRVAKDLLDLETSWIICGVNRIEAY